MQINGRTESDIDQSSMVAIKIRDCLLCGNRQNVISTDYI